jgi:spermidine synthase
LFTVVGTFHVTQGPTTLTSYYEGIEGPEVLSYEEGIGGTVKVYRDKWDDRVLSINGFPVAGTGFEPQDAQKALAHLPLLLSNAPSPRVNIVGFGAGGTSWGVMQYNVKEVDCVELVPGVLDAAIWFPEINHGVLSEPQFNLIMGDGRNHALVTDKEYDVITIDATSPKMAGNGSLYSLEFYELLERRLSADGLLVQWVPLHLLSGQEVRMIAKTFITVFPHTTLWFTPLRQYFILVGTRAKLKIDFESLSGKLGTTNVQRDLELLNVTDPIDVLGWFAMGEEALATYVGDARLNTDNHPYLEFTPAMAYFESGRYRVENTLTIRDSRESVLPFLVNMGETDEEIAAVAARVQKRFEATYHSISGDMLDFVGMREQAIVEYEWSSASRTYHLPQSRNPTASATVRSTLRRTRLSLEVSQARLARSASPILEARQFFDSSMPGATQSPLSLRIPTRAPQIPLDWYREFPSIALSSTSCPE